MSLSVLSVAVEREEEARMTRRVRKVDMVSMAGPRSLQSLGKVKAGH